MASPRSDLPVFVEYLLVLALQGPVWLGGGLLWGGIMATLTGMHPVNALVGGFAWGVSMWVVCGTLSLVALAWRLSAEFPAADREAFLDAIETACAKLKFAVLDESEDEVVLEPKRVLVSLRLQEMRVEFAGGVAVLSGPSLSVWAFKKELKRVLAQPSEG